MENSTKPSYEQGEQGNFSVLLSISMGFSLFWMLFFFALLQNPAVNTSPNMPGIALPLPVAMCLGLAAMDIIIFKRCDFFSGERGHKALWAIVSAHTILPGIVILAHALDGSSVFDCFGYPAWIVFGVGIGALLALWSELLVSFTKGFASKAIALSACIGALLYFVLSSLPIVVSVCFLCVAPAVSLALLRTLEKELPSAPFVSRAESIERHRLTKPIDVLNTMYGIVFGLSICMLSHMDPSTLLYGSIALAIAAGALIMIPFFSKNTDKMMHGRIQKILFPVLVIGLLPVPFVPEGLQLVCTLVILAGFICLTLVNLDALYCLVKKYHVAPFYLVGRGHSPIIIGVAAGYLIAYVMALTDIVGDAFLAVVSLVVVVILSAAITFINFDKDHLEDEHETDQPDPTQGHPSKGPWKTKCEIVAKRYDLSAREIEVFNLLAKGRGTTYIQEKLYISSHTVKSHVYKIYKKMGINSREELITLVEETPFDETADQSDARKPQPN